MRPYRLQIDPLDADGDGALQQFDVNDYAIPAIGFGEDALDISERTCPHPNSLSYNEIGPRLGIFTASDDAMKGIHLMIFDGYGLGASANDLDDTRGF